MRILALLLLVCAATAGAGELTDHGPNSFMFHDAATGLYWFDPLALEGISATSAAYLSAASSTWDQATDVQVAALLGSTGAGGAALETIMGPRSSTIGSGGPRWLGLVDTSESYDGYLLQSGDTPDFTTITDESSQSGAAGFTHGAWFVAATDPLAAPRLDHLGGADVPYFYDEETGFYWQDPANFVGMTREEMETWIGENPDWRWATEPEVCGLVFKRAVGDMDLEDVIGPRQFTIGYGGPRWIGYYDGVVTSAVILQPLEAIGSLLIMVSDIQGGAASWNPGGWMVSTVNPTPVETRSLSEVKDLFD